MKTIILTDQQLEDLITAVHIAYPLLALELKATLEDAKNA
jgi:hypothetical protein